MSSKPDPLVQLFAHHVATRDAPPAPAPARQDREAILDRLDAALHRLGVRMGNRRATLARLCLALAQQHRATAAQLAAEVGRSRQATWRAMAELLPPGLVSYTEEGRNTYYRFTRAGEDSLLPLLTGEPAGATPAG